MKSRLVREFVPQVKFNCNISDANYWGYYSICGLLLRLRELYRAEQGLKPWDPVDEKDVSTWIGNRERLWQDLQGLEPRPLNLEGTTVDAFSVSEINSLLIPHGLIYSAGYGLYGKPVFFLADLHTHDKVEDIDIFTTDKEHARKLSDHPAMLQGRRIFARRSTAAVFIWHKYQEYAAGKKCQWLSVAFSSYGISESSLSGQELECALDRVTEEELRTYVYHEIGEAFETDRSGRLWADMIMAVIQSRASIYLRALKDTLADVSPWGMLKHIIEEKKTGSLAFYVSALSGYRRNLARGMPEVFMHFMKEGDWQYVERERSRIYEHACREADTLMAKYAAGKSAETLIAEVETRLTPERPR